MSKSIVQDSQNSRGKADASGYHRHSVVSNFCFALDPEFYKRGNNHNIQHTRVYNSFKLSVELGKEGVLQNLGTTENTDIIVCTFMERPLIVLQIFKCFKTQKRKL